jgi:hypothetical protein
LISVYDCTGIKASDLTGDIFKLMKAMMKVMQAHYPERSDKMLIINAPKFFTTIWSIITPMIDPVTKTKIKICGANFQEELFSVVDPENVPVEFGGTDTTPFGQSEEEKALRAYADELNGGPGGSYAVSRAKHLADGDLLNDTPVGGAADEEPVADEEELAILAALAAVNVEEESVAGGAEDRGNTVVTADAPTVLTEAPKEEAPAATPAAQEAPKEEATPAAQEAPKEEATPAAQEAPKEEAPAATPAAQEVPKEEAPAATPAAEST